MKHSLKSIRGLVALLQWSYHTSMFITGTNTSKIESLTTNYVFSTLSLWQGLSHFLFILYFQNWQILIKYQGPDRKSFVLEIMSAVKCVSVEQKTNDARRRFQCSFLTVRAWNQRLGNCLWGISSPLPGIPLIWCWGEGGGYTNWPPIHAIKGGVVCLLAK